MNYVDDYDSSLAEESKTLETATFLPKKVKSLNFFRIKKKNHWTSTWLISVVIQPYEAEADNEYVIRGNR